VEPRSIDSRTTDRCADSRRAQQIEDAYTLGHLDAFPADEPPNLVTAIYLSPLPFIRTLLSLGMDPNTGPIDDGFPPLIAALSCAAKVPGARQRTDDVHSLLRLLLKSGADPNAQRGVNDYTPLHMAVEVGDPIAVLILLDAGADPEARTRIDEYETAGEMARRAGLTVIAGLLDHFTQQWPGTRLRTGVFLLVDIPGFGEPVRRQHRYAARMRTQCMDHESKIPRFEISDDGEPPETELFIHRGQLINGVFYGMDGMRVGGTRRLYIAPHMAYGSQGVPGTVPPNTGLLFEVTILREAGGSR